MEGSLLFDGTMHGDPLNPFPLYVGRLVTGLDNSGKSTLLHRLSQGQVTALQPTERPHIDEFQLGGVSFKVGRVLSVIVMTAHNV